MYGFRLEVGKKSPRRHNKLKKNITHHAKIISYMGGIMANNKKINKANKEIMDILSEHIAPDFDKLGELMRIAEW